MSLPGERGPRPFRFGTGPGRLTDRAGLVAAAQSIERLGYSTFGMADHFMIPFAPLLALQAAADATTSLRLTQLVLAQDFRHPAVLAKELATLDVLCEGRLQIGIGAGWMRREYDQAGLRFDAASVRIERLEEVVLVLKGLFGEGPVNFTGKHFTINDLEGTPKPLQRPHPPIMIGGGGRKLLSVAARQADIVQVMPPLSSNGGRRDCYHFTDAAYAEKIGWIREAAGSRFADIELGAQLLHVRITDDPEQAFDAFYDRFARRLGPAADDPDAKAALRTSPMLAIGTLDEVCDQLRQIRARHGISYLTTPVGSTPEAMSPVVEHLTGR